MPDLDSLPLEFARIARHFRPLAGAEGLGLMDDAALFAPPPGRELVITADAIVAGVHFIGDESPDLIARKLLRVNLSDLAAKGATPLGYLLTVAVPADTPEAWFAAFAAGLAQDQAEFGFSLFGGDTTSTPGPVTLSATLIGHVAPGQMIRRSGARPGDELWVTGTIGDAALGLAVAQGQLAPDPDGYLLDRYRLPRPRLGLPLSEFATAAMDVSDGLIQDVGHLCRASGCGAVIEADSVPLSPVARVAGTGWLETMLTGGDDYELLLAVSPDRASALKGASRTVAVNRVGRIIKADPTLAVIDGRGQPIPLARGGWSHFEADHDG